MLAPTLATGDWESEYSSYTFYNDRAQERRVLGDWGCLMNYISKAPMPPVPRKSSITHGKN